MYANCSGAKWIFILLPIVLNLSWEKSNLIREMNWVGQREKWTLSLRRENSTIEY